LKNEQDEEEEEEEEGENISREKASVPFDM
jgi:hypothetical protein